MDTDNKERSDWDSTGVDLFHMYRLKIEGLFEINFSSKNNPFDGLTEAHIANHSNKPMEFKFDWFSKIDEEVPKSVIINSGEKEAYVVSGRRITVFWK